MKLGVFLKYFYANFCEVYLKKHWWVSSVDRMIRVWYTILVTAWIGESHLLKWQKSSIAQNYIELPHFIMRHRQAVRQRTLTPPSQVRLLLAQLDKTPHGCWKNPVFLRGFSLLWAFCRCLQRHKIACFCS